MFGHWNFRGVRAETLLAATPEERTRLFAKAEEEFQRRRTDSTRTAGEWRRMEDEDPPWGEDVLITDGKTMAVAHRRSGLPNDRGEYEAADWRAWEVGGIEEYSNDTAITPTYWTKLPKLPPKAE